MFSYVFTQMTIFVISDIVLNIETADVRPQLVIVMTIKPTKSRTTKNRSKNKVQSLLSGLCSSLSRLSGRTKSFDDLRRLNLSNVITDAGSKNQTRNWVTSKPRRPWLTGDLDTEQLRIIPNFFDNSLQLCSWIFIEIVDIVVHKWRHENDWFLLLILLDLLSQNRFILPLRRVASFMDNLKVKNLTNSCFLSHFRSDSRDSIADNVQKTNTPSLKVSTRSFSVYHVYYYYSGSFSFKTLWS